MLCHNNAIVWTVTVCIDKAMKWNFTEIIIQSNLFSNGNTFMKTILLFGVLYPASYSFSLILIFSKCVWWIAYALQSQESFTEQVAITIGLQSIYPQTNSLNFLFNVDFIYEGNNFLFGDPNAHASTTDFIMLLVEHMKILFNSTSCVCYFSNVVPAFRHTLLVAMQLSRLIK